MPWPLQQPLLEVYVPYFQVIEKKYPTQKCAWLCDDLHIRVRNFMTQVQIVGAQNRT